MNHLLRLVILFTAAGLEVSRSPPTWELQNLVPPRFSHCQAAHTQSGKTKVRETLNATPKEYPRTKRRQDSRIKRNGPGKLEGQCHRIQGLSVQGRRNEKKNTHCKKTCDPSETLPNFRTHQTSRAPQTLIRRLRARKTHGASENKRPYKRSIRV